MDVDDRRIYKVVGSVTLAAVLLLAMLAWGVAMPGRADDAPAANLVAVDSVDAVPAPNNKNSDEVGVCVYSEAQNKHSFKKLPKPKKEGKEAKDSTLAKEIKKGGQVANSASDCDEFNAMIANPSKHEHQDDVIDGENLDFKADSGPVVKPSPEAVEGLKVFAGPSEPAAK